MSPVEGGILALIGLGLGATALVYLRARARALLRARGRVFHAFASARGLVHRPSKGGFYAGGAMRSVEVHVRLTLGRAHKVEVQYSARPSVPVPPVVVLARTAAVAPPGLTELATNDLAFDAELAAFGTEHPSTRALLGPETRAALLSLTSPATRVTRLALGPEDLSLELVADADEAFSERWLAAPLDLLVAIATGRRPR